MGCKLVVANAFTHLIAQSFHLGIGRIVTIRIRADVFFQLELETAEVDLVVAEAFYDIERLSARGIADE